MKSDLQLMGKNLNKIVMEVDTKSKDCPIILAVPMIPKFLEANPMSHNQNTFKRWFPMILKMMMMIHLRRIKMVK